MKTPQDSQALLKECEVVLAAAQDQLAKLVPDWLFVASDENNADDLEEYEQVMESIEALLSALAKSR
ncbi:hypothetical protein [Endozoicomonas sp.]|uniref:hypothetical protein n=1 Tax=Endozoicomonas sp. TaxID=1892382 RepID=UPI00383A02E7